MERLIGVDLDDRVSESERAIVLEGRVNFDGEETINEAVTGTRSCENGAIVVLVVRRRLTCYLAV